MGPGPSLKPPWLSSQPQRSPDSAQVWTSGKEHSALVTFLVQIPLWGVMSAQLNPQGRKHTRRPSSLLPLPRQQKFTREVPPGSLLSSAPHLAVAPDSLRPWGGNAQRPELSHLATSSTDQWEDQLEPSQPGPADHPQRLPAGGHQTCYQHLRNAPCPTSSALEPSPKVCIALTRSREGGPLPLWLGKHWEKGRGTSVPLCGASCLPAPPTPHCAGLKSAPTASSAGKGEFTTNVPASLRGEGPARPHSLPAPRVSRALPSARRRRKTLLP